MLGNIRRARCVQKVHRREQNGPQPLEVSQTRPLVGEPREQLMPVAGVIHPRPRMLTSHPAKLKPEGTEADSPLTRKRSSHSPRTRFDSGRVELAGLEPATSWVRCGLPDRPVAPILGSAGRNPRPGDLRRGSADTCRLAAITLDSATGARSLVAGYWAQRASIRELQPGRVKPPPAPRHRRLSAPLQLANALLL